jgi:hypothetical protein
MTPAQALCVFQAGDTDRYAVSYDSTGCNLPTDGHTWQLGGTVARDQLQDELPPAIEELDVHGYSIVNLIQPIE